VPRNPSRVDAKRGDHFRQADFTGLIPPWKPDSFRLTDHPGVDWFAEDYGVYYYSSEISAKVNLVQYGRVDLPLSTA
jgi:hypothetical protein